MNPRFRVVFDTNIYISAIVFGGNPKQCLELARSGEVELFISHALLLELVLKLRDKFGRSEDELKVVIEWVDSFTSMLFPKNKIKKIKHDADNRVLECAVSCNADYIISGDKKHLLSLKRFKNIPIITANDLLTLFYHTNS